MNKDQIKAMKVGDEVGHCRFGNWGDIYEVCFSKVAKISPVRGEIKLENGRTFNADGWEKGRGYARVCLRDVADLRKRQADQQAKTKCRSQVNTIRNYMLARHTLSTAEKQELAALVDSITPFDE